MCDLCHSRVCACACVAFAISSECRSVCVALVAGAGRRCTYTVSTYCLSFGQTRGNGCPQVCRRAVCRSEIPSMFAVRMRLSQSRRELSSTCIESSDERMGSVAGRTARSLRSPRAAIGESNREPRRRSDEACVRRLTVTRRLPLSVRPQAHRQRARHSTFQGYYPGPSGLAVYWCVLVWLSGPPTYNVGQRPQI